jgi:hypothetical protein
MRIRTGLLAVALLCGGILVAVGAENTSAQATKEAKSAKPPGGGGRYCCSSACCDLYADCNKDPKNCNGWHICQQQNNNCSCTGTCKYPPNIARTIVDATTDPLVKAAGSSSDCQWNCLSQLRTCLQKSCRTSEGDCQKCTQKYVEREKGCSSPAETAKEK